MPVHLTNFDKSLRNVISDLKQRIVEGEFTSYAWLPMASMWADVQTKEKKIFPDLEIVFLHNEIRLGDTFDNKVFVFNQEVWMTNIRN